MTSEFQGDIQTLTSIWMLLVMSVLVVKGILGSPYMGIETKGSPGTLGSWRMFPSEEGTG